MRTATDGVVHRNVPDRISKIGDGISEAVGDVNRENTGYDLFVFYIVTRGYLCRVELSGLCVVSESVVWKRATTSGTELKVCRLVKSMIIHRVFQAIESVIRRGFVVKTCSLTIVGAWKLFGGQNVTKPQRFEIVLLALPVVVMKRRRFVVIENTTKLFHHF